MSTTTTTDDRIVRTLIINLCYLSIIIANDIQSDCNVTRYDDINNRTIVINGSVKTDGCLEGTCLPKCCPLNYVFSRTGKECRPKKTNGDDLSTRIRSLETDFKKRLDTEYVRNNYSLVYGYSRPGFYLKTGKFAVLPNGSLSMLFINRLKNIEQYCLDEAAEDGQLTAWICLSSDIPIAQTTITSVVHYNVHAVCMLISIVCLLSTFAIYCTKQFQNLHGKCLKQHASALIVSFSLMIVLKLRHIDYEDRPYCCVLGILAQFFILASFFWLNVMCFDLFRTFRVSRYVSKESCNKKFLKYFIYAWGCPSFITITELIIEYIPGIPEWITKPKFGETSCWFDEGATFYLYVPIGLILLTNTFMFISTVFFITRNKENSKYLNRNGGERRINACEIRSFNICFKLYIVMGLNWIIEMLAWWFKGSDWYIADISNELQGLFIFLIFVCKRRVLYSLDEKFCPTKRIFTQKSQRSVWSTVTTNSTVNPRKNIINMNVLSDEDGRLR